jgi:hypothetical protein
MILYATQFLVNCVEAEFRSVSPALATIDDAIQVAPESTWCMMFKR